MKKVVTIFGNISISKEILEAITMEGLEGGYTEWPRIIGNGPVTGPRLDSHVWPGANVGFQVVADDEKAGKLMDRLQLLRDSDAGRQSGLYAYMTSVERELV